MIEPTRPATLVTLSEVARSSEPLLDPLEITLPNGVLYTNVADYNPAFATHLLKDIYVTRACQLKGISLVSLPAGATVLASEHFALKVDEKLVIEQYPVFFQQNADRINEVMNKSLPVQEINVDALLIARYGIFTWGHWIGELLPKAILAEAAYPGRFAIVLPHQVLADPSPYLPWLRIRQSLAAYGFDERRIISISPDKNYQFSQLFAVTSVWSDHMIHPGAARVMRSAIRQQIAPFSVSGRRAAIARLSSYGRVLANALEIEMLLCARDFSVYSVGAMPFLDQVALFSSAELLFGVLGSDLANLVYSPTGVKVITVAPANFGDRFFYALILANGGTQIDLRGPITELNEQIAHKSAFQIPLSEVAHAITLFNEN